MLKNLICLCLYCICWNKKKCALFINHFAVGLQEGQQKPSGKIPFSSWKEGKQNWNNSWWKLPNFRRNHWLVQSLSYWLCYLVDNKFIYFFNLQTKKVVLTKQEYKEIGEEEQYLFELDSVVEKLKELTSLTTEEAIIAFLSGRYWIAWKLLYYCCYYYHYYHPHYPYYYCNVLNWLTCKHVDIDFSVIQGMSCSGAACWLLW